MPNILVTVLWLIAVAFHVVGSTPALAQERVKAFYIGHSLTSDIPDMVRALAADAGKELEFREQNVPGAPLHWQWDQGKNHQGEPQYQGTYDKALPEGDYDALVVTDSVPRGGQWQEAETVDFLARFHAYALEQNPATQVYYYETWHHLTSGTPQRSEYDTASPQRHLKWRERLDADRAMWQSIVDRANEKNAGKGPPIRIIPAGQALGRFVDALKESPVPGFAEAKDLFDDEIHPNPYGKYLVACVHYAVLFGESPEGLGFDLKDRWGRSYWNTPNWQQKQWPPPNKAAVALMQKVAWEVVQAQKQERPADGDR